MENRQQAARQEPRPVRAPTHCQSKHKVEFIWVKGVTPVTSSTNAAMSSPPRQPDGSNLDIDAGFNESDL